MLGVLGIPETNQWEFFFFLQYLAISAIRGI